MSQVPVLILSSAMSGWGGFPGCYGGRNQTLVSQRSVIGDWFGRYLINSNSATFLHTIMIVALHRTRRQRTDKTKQNRFLMASRRVLLLSIYSHRLLLSSARQQLSRFRVSSQAPCAVGLPSSRSDHLIAQQHVFEEAHSRRFARPFTYLPRLWAEG